MSTLKTLPNDASVSDFLESFADETKRDDAKQLLGLFEKVTKQKAKMWGTSIVGFGMYHYKSERSRQEGDWPLVAFSPRKQNLTLYFMPSVEIVNEFLPELGKCKKSGGSCLYINKLSDVNTAVLESVIDKAYQTAKAVLSPES